jgi:D-glycero-D-manno-heptose 1,7-bisphosphate phosphatase
MPLRAVFLDRDGTIISDKGYVHQLHDLEFIHGALEGLTRLSRIGIEIHVVTNQSGVARGLFSENDLSAFNAHMAAQLFRHDVKLTGIHVCPHHPEATLSEYRVDCICRKPRPGLLLKAMDIRRIAPTDAVMIGDKNTDIEAGNAAGLVTYLVETGCGAGEKHSTTATYVVRDLLAAVEHILQGGGNYAL